MERIKCPYCQFSCFAEKTLLIHAVDKHSQPEAKLALNNIEHKTVYCKKKVVQNSPKTSMESLDVGQDFDFDTWFNSIFNDEGIQALFKNSH